MVVVKVRPKDFGQGAGEAAAGGVEEGGGGGDLGVLVKTKRTSWKAAQLARAINGRRAKRGISSKRLTKTEMHLHQWTMRDWRRHTRLTAKLMSTSRHGVELYERTDQHYLIERNIGRLGNDTRKLVMNARVKVF
jgi:hypothetical protein